MAWKFSELPNGISSSDTFRRVFERLDPKGLSECLYEWLSCNRKEDCVVAIDGKTIRGSGGQSHTAYHVVNAFVTENQMVLGEIAVPEKSNEITAVPKLLQSLEIHGSVVTADVMGCQKEIMEKVREREADYVIALKGNQPSLLEDVSLYFEHFAAELPCFVTREKDHGRIEKREYRLLTDISWLPGAADWRDLRAIGSATSTFIKEDKTCVETRYFITSLNHLERFAYAVRKHWTIENQLHWCLDVIFDEDALLAKKDNSPLNLNILRKTALALCKHTGR